MASSSGSARSTEFARRPRGPRIRPIGTVGAPGFSVTDLVEGFQRKLQAEERSPCTVKQYGHIARTFLAFAQKPLAEVTARDLESYREYLVLQRHYAKNSLYTTIRGLACLFRSLSLIHI